MKSRWLINIIMLAIVVGLGAYFYLQPKNQVVASKAYDISQIKLADIQAISVEYPTKAAIVYKKIDNEWRMIAPYSARVEQQSIYHIMSIVAAQSNNKFPATDLAKFGLDKPKLKLSLNQEVFTFGEFNSVTSEQYVAYKDAIYLLPGSYLEFASIQINALLDKSPIAQTEKIAGFDFAKLEQWQDLALNIDLKNNIWIANTKKVKIDQAAMKEWFEGYWTGISVTSVEPYKTSVSEKLPGFDVKLANGKRVHFDKLQESPTLILVRPDEGMKYTISADIGFTLLNPPVEAVK